MRRRDGKGVEGFHEAPLVLFTALATVGGGIAAAHLLFSFLTWLPWVPGRGIVVLIALLLGSGILLSLTHLGRPLRGPFALRRVGKSPLANEVLVAGIAAGAGVLAVLIPGGYPLGAPLSWAVLFFALITVLAVGAVYRIRGQLTWGGAVTFHPLVLGMGFGLMLLLETLPSDARARAEILVLLVLLVDGFLVVRWAGTVNRALAWGAPTHPQVMASRGAAFILRVLFGVLLPAWSLLQGHLGLGVSFLLVAVLLDRFLFYGLAVKASTEAGARRVETFLSGRGG